MLSFYRVAAYTLLGLVVATSLLLHWGARKTSLSAPMLPVQRGSVPWTPRLVPAAPHESESRIKVNHDDRWLDWDFELSADSPFPYTSYGLDFGDGAQMADTVDWRRYDRLSFRVRCSPQNVMLLVLFTWDNEVSHPQQHWTHRVSSAFFPCGENWNEVDIRFEDLDTPDWWLDKFGLPLTNRDFGLDQVTGLGFVNSLQSPRRTPSNIKIAELRLVGYDPTSLYLAAAAVVLLWIAGLIWLFRRYMAAVVTLVQENVKRDLPLVAYQKLTIEPRADKEKSAVISYMAKEYANPELDLETAVSALGVNRNKINDILKTEIGLTFSGYLNKLRLTEAARLLLEQKDVNVAQIAFAVGYNNVTYFNKLFKNEYGCTPKSFKSLYQTPPQNDQE